MRPGLKPASSWMLVRFVSAEPRRELQDASLIPTLAQWVRDPVSCGVGHRRSLDPMLLWLWHRPAAAAAVLIRPLAWNAYATDAAIEIKINKKINKSKGKPSRADRE